MKAARQNVDRVKNRSAILGNGTPSWSLPIIIVISFGQRGETSNSERGVVSPRRSEVALRGDLDADEQQDWNVLPL